MGRRKTSIGWRRRALLVAAVGLAAAFGLSGCEKPPSGDLDRARAALDEARAAGGSAWAPEAFAHAERLVEEGAAEVAAQSQRYGVFRDYSRAKEMLTVAREDAFAARDAAERERRRARDDATTALARARSALEGARIALQIAPSPRDGRIELARLRTELHAVETQFREVERLIQSEEFRNAASHAADLAARVQKALARFFGAIEDRASGGGRLAAREKCSDYREALSLGRPQAGQEVCS